MMECLILGARSYDFVNDDGEQVQGVKVTYVDTDEIEDAPAAKGYTPATITADFGLWEQFTKLPAVYSLKVGTRVSRTGAKPTMYIKSLKRLKDANLAQ